MKVRDIFVMFGKRRVIVVSGVLFVILLITLFYFLPSSFALMTPLKSVEFKSEKFDYDSKESGAWKVTKSAKWLDRGTAEITFDVDTILKPKYKYRDVILVLDISSSMEGRKIEKAKADAIDLLNNLLDENENRVALISFTDNAYILSGFSRDKEVLTNLINGLTLGENTNYYKALQSVEGLLKEYINEDERGCIVLFLTDGYPNRGIPNEVGEYKLLKKQFPYAIINGIQYEMGDTILEQLKRSTDNQYIAKINTLHNVLEEASEIVDVYEKFDITDFIDDRYFYIENSSNISVNKGEVSFDKVNQKITWTLENNLSGISAQMKIKVKLKEELIGAGGVYPTNEKTEISSKLGGVEDYMISEDTPVLADNYRVIYDGNAPNGCDVSNLATTKNQSVYDTVEITKNIPKCEGYVFKKWQIITEKATRINDDYFIMPEEDVTIRAVWSDLDLDKKVDGKVYTAPVILYNMMADNAVLDNTKSEFVSTSTGIDFSQNPSDTNGRGIYTIASTRYAAYPIYYYRGNIDNNNVKFANFCWKIVRTTDTGGVKLIYNGIPDSEGRCVSSGGDEVFIGKSEFNSGTDNAKTYAGYMYSSGTNLTTNTYSSTVKQKIDEWYEKNLMDYADMLEDTVFCNDRSIYKTTNTGNNMSGVRTNFGFAGRYTYATSISPTLSCSSTSNKFSVSSSIGNGNLKYPIGLLTGDEILYSGKVGYLTTEQRWWTMSPDTHTTRWGMTIYTGPVLSGVFSTINVNETTASDLTSGVRPAISLKPMTVSETGNGTPENPYIILKN